MMQHILGIFLYSEKEKESEQPSTIELQLDYAQLEKINNTSRKNINPKILPNFMSGLEQKLRRSLIFLVGVLVIYLLILITLNFMTRRDLCRRFSGQQIRYKFYRCEYIVYDILPLKILQLYCTLDLMKYTWGKDENDNRQIITANCIRFKNGFDLHRIFWGLLIMVIKFQRLYFH